MEKRQLILGIVFVVTAVASFYPDQDKPANIVEATKPQVKHIIAQDKITKPAQSRSADSRAWIIKKDAKDLFYVKPIVLAAPAQTKPAIVEPPPQPVAPPLPFTYLGKMIEQGKITVFVTMAGKNYALKGGEVIDSIYAVQSVDAQSIVFTYIPLKSEQVLVTRGQN